MKQRLNTLLASKFSKIHKVPTEDIYSSIGLDSAILINTAVAFFFHILAAIILDVGITKAIKCAIWYCFMLLSGSAIHQLLLPTLKDFLSFSVISCIMGYCYTIILFFATVPFSLQAIVPYITLGSTLLALGYLSKDAKGKEYLYKKNDIPVTILFFVYLFICLIAYSGCIITPNKTGSTWFPTDHAWWVGNAIALTKNFPPSDLRVVDTTLYYHYFSSIQLAMESLATDVDIFTLSSAFYPLMKCIIYFGGLYILLEKIVERPWVRIWGLCLIIFCTGLEHFVIVTHVAHSLTTPFGMDIGVGLGACMLYLFCLQYEKHTLDYRLLFATILVSAACAGTKAPVAVIVIAAAGFICIAWLFSGKFKLSLSYGVGLLAAFFSVTIGCAGLLNPDLARVGSFSLTEFSTLGNLQEYISGIPFPIQWVISLMIELVCIHPLLFILFILGGFNTFTDRKHWNLLDFGLLFAGIIGLLLGEFNIQEGNSQMYFSLAAFIPMLALGVRRFELRQKSATTRRIISGWICCLLMIFQILLFFFNGYTYQGKGAIQALRQGWYNITSSKSLQKNKLEEVQHEDAEALQWIRSNTNKDSILLSDRSVLGEMPGYMYYGVFSERQMFLEGDVYVRKQHDALKQIVVNVFQNDNTALRQAKDMGVTHIVQTKWMTPNFSPNQAWAEIVYQTSSIAVWELK